jgi:S1-C subfamily serine protease
VLQDKVQAYKWLSLGGRSMVGECREAFESELAEFAGTMNPQQIALAERFIREFLARTNQTKGGEKRDQAGGEPPKASGSGFFISDDGALLTNFHVVDGASRIVVNTKRGSFPAKVVKLDSANDIAIIKVSGSAFKSLPLVPSRGAKLADTVFTIGFPNPEMQGTEPKFTDGRISSLSGAQDDTRYFQISVAVQPGNSGGPLVNSAGSVVGIVTARLSDRAALEESGALPQNVNYALKSSYVLSLLESMPELAGKLREPWPGKDRKFDEAVKDAQEAVALVLVY